MCRQVFYTVEDCMVTGWSLYTNRSETWEKTEFILKLLEKKVQIYQVFTIMLSLQQSYEVGIITLILFVGKLRFQL